MTTMSKTQTLAAPPALHLETIYEESGGSFVSTVIDSNQPSFTRRDSSPNNMTHGLISARSIPTVHVQRRRINEHYQQSKPPIEVRYRDGSKYYIHPSTATSTMRRLSHSSRHRSSLLSSKQITSKTKSSSSQPAIVLTIITAQDLQQAGVTPTNSSPDESDPLKRSQSSSSMDTITTEKFQPTKDVQEERLQATSAQSIVHNGHPTTINNSISNLPFPSGPRYRAQSHNYPPMQPYLRHPQQNPTIRSQSLPTTRSFLPPVRHTFMQHNLQKVTTPMQSPPDTTSVLANSKKCVPSLQITLTKDENEIKTSTKRSHAHVASASSESTPFTNGTKNIQQKRTIRPPASVLVGSSHSAFRPFLKPTAFVAHPLPVTPRIPLTINGRPQLPRPAMKNSPPQSSLNSRPAQVVHPHIHQQQYRPTIDSSSSSFNNTNVTHQTNSAINNTKTITHRSLNSHIPQKSIHSALTSNKSISNMNTSIPMNISKLSHVSTAVALDQVDSPFAAPKVSREQADAAQSLLLAVDPKLEWHAIKSKSLYEIPRLASAYARNPLRITLPVVTPTRNQKLLVKHDLALETRLLNAGLSPETIALYERILEVADGPSSTQAPPPQILDQYPFKALF